MNPHDHDPHDHDLATAVAGSYTPAATTAQVNDRVTAVITRFEDDRHKVQRTLHRLIFAAGVALWLGALAVGIDLILVTR